MVLQFPKPQNLSRFDYLRLAFNNARAQGIPLDPKLNRELTNLILQKSKAPF